MSPETAVVIVIGLLWGPTMLWLLFRLARGQTANRSFGMRDALGGSATHGTSASTDLSTLVDSFGFWLCDSCKSLNRAEARRCYSCRAARDGSDAPDAGAPGAAPAPALVAANATTWKAVGPGRPVTAATGNDGATIVTGVTMVSAVASDPAASAAAGIDGGALVLAGRSGDERSATTPESSPLDAAPGPPVAAAAETRIRPAASAWHREASPSDLPEVTETAAPVGSEGMAAAAAAAAVTSPTAVPVPAPAPRAGLAVCPFLGLDGDPSTWFDFPDPSNQCHAVQPDNGTFVASVLRLVGARPSARILDAGTQRSRCLSAAHRECARYLLAMKVLASSSGVEGAEPDAPVQQPDARVASAEPQTVAGDHEQDRTPGPQTPRRQDDRELKVAGPESTEPVAPGAPATDPANAPLGPGASEGPSAEPPDELVASTTGVPAAEPAKARRSRAAKAPRVEPGNVDPATGPAQRPARRSRSAAAAATSSDEPAPRRRTATTRTGSRTRKAAPDEHEATPAVEADVESPGAVKDVKAAEADASVIGAQQGPAADDSASETSPDTAPKRRKRARPGSSPSGTKKRGASGSATSKSRKQVSADSTGSRSARS